MKSGHTASASEYRSLRALLFGALLATIPLLVMYLLWVWRYAHYQFYPFLIGATGWIMWIRLREYRLQSGNSAIASPPAISAIRTAIGLAIIWLGGMAEVVAINFFSPWVGVVAFWIVGLGIITLLPRPLFQAWISPWLLMLMIIRLPLRFDETLILKLQYETAKLSSVVLDWLKIDHLREGVVVELTGRVMFVEEACSGVQSLFSLLALTGLLCLWKKRAIIHSLFLFVGAVLGAGLMNIVRIVSASYAYENWKFDLLQEPHHTILGLVIFLGSLFWLISCDEFLSFWFSSIPQTGDPSRSSSLFVVWWNALTGQKVQPDPLKTATKTRIEHKQSPARRILYFLTGGVLAVVGGMSILSIIAHWAPAKATVSTRLTAEESDISNKLRQLTESSLPEQLSGWNRIGFEVENRSAGNMFGNRSGVWIYETPYGPARCSIDFPFTGWHDLRTCYTNIGWTVTETEPYAVPGQSDLTNTEATMHKSTGEASYMAYNLSTFNFESLPATASLSGSLLNRLGKSIFFHPYQQSRTLQFQIFLPLRQSLTGQDKTEIREHLELFRQALAEQVSNQD